MANRTQIICLHEGEKGRSIDPIFINRLIRSLKPVWIRPWEGNNIVRPVDCGGRKNLIKVMPQKLKEVLAAGGDTTLMVWADVDDNMAGPEALKEAFWETAQMEGISREQFDSVVFIFAEDRLENWIEFLETGVTDETREGPRVKHGRQVADAANKLAGLCLAGTAILNIPPSLDWSCKNWSKLKKRMAK